MQWSKIPPKVTNWFKEQYDSNNCEYHNWDHVTRLYEIVNNWQWRYNPVLDYAIMGHDVVYDNRPDKEIRSANLTLAAIKSFIDMGEINNISDYDLNMIEQQILSTIDHKVTSIFFDHSLIILDLYDLSIREKRLENLEKITAESMKLYGITEAEFYENNIKFMEKLKLTMQHNQTLNSINSDFYASIAKGIDEQIDHVGTLYLLT